MTTLTPDPALYELFAEIDARVQNIRSQQTQWPCRRGCDLCCHRLADIPRLTRAEWETLRIGLAALPTEQFAKIRLKLEAISLQTTRPIVCPMLDQALGACRVYAHRPIACRTYGFYVQRELGLYCQEIEMRVVQGDYAAVIWGNQDAVEQRLKSLGEKRELTAWFADWVGPAQS